MTSAELAPVAGLPAADDLPDGWTIAPLAEVADCVLGKMLDRTKHRKGTELPYLRNVNVQWGKVDTSDVSTMFFEDHQLDRFGLRADDLLVCEGGEPGRAAIWDGRLPEMKFQKALHRVRPGSEMDPRWILWQLRLASLAGSLEEHFTGSTIKHFTGRALARFPVVVAPLPEQRRIVAKIEALLSLVNAGRESLANVATILKRFRQSILAAACTGRLTEDWRRKTEADQMGVDSGAPAHLHELPDSWQLTYLADIASKEKHALSSGPFGSVLGTKDYVGDGVPVIRGQNIGTATFLLRNFVYVSEPKATQLGRSTARPGDIVVVAVGSSGQAAVVPECLPRAVLSQNCNKITLDTARAIPQFVLIALQTEVAKQHLQQLTTDTARPFLSLRSLKKSLVPLPRVQEQAEIVRRVEVLFTFASTIDQHAATGLCRTDQLTQRILSKALHGELAPWATEPVPKFRQP